MPRFSRWTALSLCSVIAVFNMVCAYVFWESLALPAFKEPQATSASQQINPAQVQTSFRTAESATLTNTTAPSAAAAAAEPTAAIAATTITATTIATTTISAHVAGAAFVTASVLTNTTERQPVISNYSGACYSQQPEGVVDESASLGLQVLTMYTASDCKLACDNKGEECASFVVCADANRIVHYCYLKGQADMALKNNFDAKKVTCRTHHRVECSKCPSKEGDVCWNGLDRKVQLGYKIRCNTEVCTDEELLETHCCTPPKSQAVPVNICADGDAMVGNDPEVAQQLPGPVSESLLYSPVSESTLYVPWVYYGSEWYPLCVHHLVDPHDGAAAFCKKLGFQDGALSGAEKFHVSKNAMAVGNCRQGEEDLTACTGGGNGWGNFDWGSGVCRASTSSEKVGVRIQCFGGQHHRSKSCVEALREVTWFDSSSGWQRTAPFMTAEPFCRSKGGTLCNRQEYCPGGRLARKFSGDQWAPYSGDGDNAWIQVGENSLKCQTHHRPHRPPAPPHIRPLWGPASTPEAVRNLIACCPAHRPQADEGRSTMGVCSDPVAKRPIFEDMAAHGFCTAPCKSGNHSTCQHCYAAGRRGWPPGTLDDQVGASRLYELGPVHCDKGFFNVFADVNQLRSCWNQCNLDQAGWYWNTPKIDPFDMRAMDMQNRPVPTPQAPWLPRKAESLKSSCPTGGIRDARQGGEEGNCTTYARVGWVTAHGETLTLYHWVMDNLFTHFVTLIHIARFADVPADQVDIFGIYGVDRIHSNHQMWVEMFGPIKAMEQMSGCYKHVFFGVMYNSRTVAVMHQPSVRAWLVDGVTATWTTAFVLNQRERWTPLIRQHTTSPGKYFVLAYHKRMTKWVWEYNWTSKQGLADHGLTVESHDLTKHPLAKQAAIIMNSEGIISETGAGFAWQFWLKPMSFVFIISEPGIPGFPQWTCKYFPETFHENPALHAGHTSIHWHLCGGEAAFTRHEPGRVLDFGIRLWRAAQNASMAKTCVLFRDRNRTPMWPFCDVDIEVPVPCSPLPSWPPYKQVGIHYDVTSKIYRFDRPVDWDRIIP